MRIQSLNSNEFSEQFINPNTTQLMEELNRSIFIEEAYQILLDFLKITKPK